MKPVRVLALLEATSVTGPAKNLLQFARLAASQEFDPAIDVRIVTFRRSRVPDVFTQAAEAVGIPVYPLEERGALDRSVIPSLVALADEIQPDILQTHAVKSHFLLRCSGLQHRRPWIAFHHGYTWPHWRVHLYNQLDRWSLRAPRRVVTVSEPFREELTGMGVRGEKIRVVHNAIEPGWGTRRDHAAMLRQQLGIPPGKPTLLIVGRLSAEKDHVTLLQAVAAVHRQGLAAHLVVVGEGPHRPVVEQTIRDLALQQHVTLTGQVASAEPYYGISDVAVLSSLSEGSPNALLEAMSAGIPVVATRVGGIPEIVTDRDSALLVQPRDASGMAAAIAAILSDVELAQALRQRASQLVHERHTPEQRVRTLLGIYGELTG